MLKDVNHYLWLSALRECWKDSEKEHINSIYNNINQILKKENIENIEKLRWF